ncbi:hypothetical protein SBF1_2060003 [Candidatus Desulfosporosinus infrequens]|uniref:Uncharacterized protein n=1 Tax=Candidatus Desulfosporosinus infrequens TaxID=2043169 RepID=A0A2U3KI54_9FIRM|nr:hypothetical protein SBF1_2060003 [Candidatus Desulfosporosinus infrequens]
MSENEKEGALRCWKLRSPESSVSRVQKTVTMQNFPLNLWSGDMGLL